MSGIVGGVFHHVGAQGCRHQVRSWTGIGRTQSTQKCAEYYHYVRILDEIDNRWPHAKKSDTYVKERPYERNPRADIKVPRLVQASQYIRHYRRAQHRASQSEYDKGEEDENG